MNKEILIQQINQRYSTWKMAELNNTTQPNIRYWLKKYNLKTQRTINDEQGLKLCPKCQISKSKDNFYKSIKSSSYCKSCIHKSNIKRSKNNKQKAVDYFGGKCSNCGYNKCNAALEFHHIDSFSKEFSPAHLMRTNFDKLKSELDKCVLLCANCHREHHSSNF